MDHQLLSVHYQLYTVADGERTLEEQTTREHPFKFITGFGVSLEALEKQLCGLAAGTEFDITLPPADAFGEYDPAGVHTLDRQLFFVDDHFDAAHVFPGAIITLSDSEDHQFPVRVTECSGDGVTVDSNHPLAGKTLNFVGEVIENRPATDAEVGQLIKQLTCSCGGGCGGNCSEAHHCGDCHE